MQSAVRHVVDYDAMYFVLISKSYTHIRKTQTLGLVIMLLITSAKLLYVEPG